MHRGRVKQLAMAAAWAAALAMTLGAGEPLEASINSRTGGPLWWMPENDENWSRFHDVWHNSANVELAAPGAATSFPEHTWAVTRIRGYATEAMPNSACDVQNGIIRNNVGPPLTVAEYPSLARNERTPDDGSGGLGGLQMSVHIGEWWQGLYFQETPGSTYTWPSGWNSQQYGSFRVTTQNNDGTEILAFGPTGPWDRMTSRPGMFLEGGGSGTWGCIGQALVMMHGTPNGRGVYPDTPTDADGSTCYSQARLFVLRGNTEARCEPDLSQRYALTEDFWEWFEQYRYSAGGARVPPHPVYGDSLPALFPDTYAGPYPLMRRGEFALFTVGEFAAPDAALQPVPWDTPDFQTGSGTERRDDLTRFVDDATRPRPFGGKTMTLRSQPERRSLHVLQGTGQRPVARHALWRDRQRRDRHRDASKVHRRGRSARRERLDQGRRERGRAGTRPGRRLPADEHRHR